MRANELLHPEIFLPDHTTIDERITTGKGGFRMKRRLFLLTAVLAILLTAAPALAALSTVDFTTGETNSTYTQLELAGLTITGKTMTSSTALPFTTGTATNLYWGNLGTLGTTAATVPVTPAAGYYIGLGVGPDLATAPITFREALVLTFAQPQNASNVHFYLQGTNQLASGGSGSPADNVRIFVLFASGENTSLDVNAAALTPSGVSSPDALDYNRWLTYIVNNVTYADERITALAIEQTYGSTTSPRGFGFANITYETPVPIPGAVWLLGTGLLGLVAIRRRHKK
jgi:hypothetical protein